MSQEKKISLFEHVNAESKYSIDYFKEKLHKYDWFLYLYFALSIIASGLSTYFHTQELAILLLLLIFVPAFIGLPIATIMSLKRERTLAHPISFLFTSIMYLTFTVQIVALAGVIIGRYLTQLIFNI